MTTTIFSQMKKLVVSKKGKRSLFDGIVLDVSQDKQHSMVTRQDTEEHTPKLTLRSRSVNRSFMSDTTRKRKGSPVVNGNINKYVSLAEGILHFQKDTPERFHTKRRSGTLQANKSLFKKRSTTKALTPNLISHFRNRPVTALTQEQKEELELEEMKKNRVKAVPLNEKVLLPPELPVREVKPPTKPSPFNLTQVTKKMPLTQEAPFKFTAKPVPAHILKGPVGIGSKHERLLTVPQSPTVTKRPRSRPIRVPVLEIQDNKSYVVQMKEVNFEGVVLPAKAKTTTIRPFSFEERDRELLKKKEQKIQEYLLEEKKAREFHANPVPNFKSQHKLSLSIQPTKPEPFNFKIDERLDKRHEKESCKSLQFEDEPRLFRARTPKVLQMKPYEPKKPERAPLDFKEINLHTERRAKDREVFDMRMIERENMLMELKRERELMKQREMEEEVARLRKETVHKAQPVPKYIPPNIEKSKAPLTMPRSPELSYKRARNHSPANTL